MVISNSYRLPTNVNPINYDLSLTSDIESFTFHGEESILINVSEKTKTISLNAVEIDITKAILTIKNGTTHIPVHISFNEEFETVTFDFEDNIPIGEAKLAIIFDGSLNDQLRGFYRSKYTNPDGEQKYLATTQFEATDARRAFPCWDDPAVKATFDITLTIPKDLVAISNTQIESETETGINQKSYRFAQTPKMSTYLLAFIIGDMVSVNKKSSNGTLVRVWSTRGKEQQGLFALENAASMLDYFNNYFGIPYPLEKLDHIAIPDFAAGAMENWGAITYRETALLYDPENSSASTKQRILEVVAHEMAHMWFGDLVTMEWWDDLWLNESFASWMGDKAVDHEYPDWDVWTQFVFQDTNRGLSLDGLRNSHPIEAKVENPAEIRELFDAISYSKGGATLRMLEDFLGHEVFRNGLQDYLSKHQYGNARTEDLWNALEKSSGKPVTEIMNTWVKQVGYPYIQVQTSTTNEILEIKLTQNRFLYDNLLDSENADKSLWQIPVKIITSEKQTYDSSLLMKTENQHFSTNIIDTKPSWIKINAGQTGFYRVNYTKEGWASFERAIQEGCLSPVDRLGLQNDSYALMKSGHLEASAFLSLIESYTNETDSSVWSDLSVNLRGMESLLAEESFINKYRAFAQSLYKQIASAVGWNTKLDEGHLQSILRNTVLGQIGYYGNEETLETAKIKFNEFIKQPSSLHPDLRAMVYSLVAQNGGEEEYQTLWNLHSKANLHEERVRILGSLTRFKDPELLKDLLKQSLSDKVRSQDTVLVVVSTANNINARDMTWEFVKNNWSELDRRYGKGGFAIMNLVTIAGLFTTVDKAEEVELFFQNNPTPSAERTIQQSLERIRLNANWLDKNRNNLNNWFNK